MASTDAVPVPRKNTAFRVTFPLYDADGDLVTGATGLDSEVSKDAGTFADCTNEATEIATSSGMYYLDLTSTEMNADTVAVIVKSSAKTLPLVFYPEESGDIRADTVKWNGTAVASPATAGYPAVTLKVGTGTGEVNLASGKAPATIAAGDIANSAITAASIAADAITDAKVASDVTIASVTGAVGSVTGAVGSVTGNVGGNVTGSVGSVVGAVGSVTGNVGGNVVGSVATATALGSGAVNATSVNTAGANWIADHVIRRSFANAKATAGPDTKTFRSLLGAIARLVNKNSISAGTLTVTEEDDSTSLGTAAVTTTAGNPISSIDPT